jgi:hypothetical protein
LDDVTHVFATAKAAGKSPPVLQVWDAVLDADGAVVEPVTAFFAELQAYGWPTTTIRSYGMDLLRWWRFLARWGAWNRATRLDARDFARWMQIAPKPTRAHWRRQAAGEAAQTPASGPLVGVPNQVTGRAGPGWLYSTFPTAGAQIPVLNCDDS